MSPDKKKDAVESAAESDAHRPAHDRIGTLFRGNLESVVEKVASRGF